MGIKNVDGVVGSEFLAPTLQQNSTQLQQVGKLMVYLILEPEFCSATTLYTFPLEKMRF